MKKENNYYIDENNNSWYCEFYTIEQAERNSKSLGDCSNCRNCSNCSNCRNCRDCSDCSDFSDCSDCSDFKLNPQRIYSNLIGSRNSTTQVYWIDDNIQVICGCFRGDLNYFENQVKQIHANSQKHLEDYLNFIAKVRNYINN